MILLPDIILTERQISRGAAEAEARADVCIGLRPAVRRVRHQHRKAARGVCHSDAGGVRRRDGAPAAERGKLLALRQAPGWLVSRSLAPELQKRHFADGSGTGRIQQTGRAPRPVPAAGP